MTVIALVPARSNPQKKQRGGYKGLASALSFLLLFSVCPTCRADAQTVQPGKGWRFRIAVNKLPDLYDLSMGSDGSLYATQSPDDGKGRVIRLRGGRVKVIVDHLNQPRGLLVRGSQLYVTDQSHEGRLIRVNLKDGRRHSFDGLRSPEHIALLPDGDIIVTEDVLHGRVTRVSANGTTQVVASGFNEVDGLSVGPDGTIYIGESGTGRVLSYKDETLNVVVDDLDALGQVKCAADGSIWITEDGDAGRLLRLKDGVLETVLSGLSTPQGIAEVNGVVFVAERGRNRILIAEPKP